MLLIDVAGKYRIRKFFQFNQLNIILIVKSEYKISHFLRDDTNSVVSI